MTTYTIRSPDMEGRPMTAALQYKLHLSAAKLEHADARRELRFCNSIYGRYSARLRDHEEDMADAYARARSHLAAAKRLKKRAGVVMELGS